MIIYNYHIYPFALKQKNGKFRLCILSGENTNTTKEISLVVFFVGRSLLKAPSGRELAPKATEGECVIMRSIYISSHAGSFHHFVVPLPPGGRLLRVIPLRIVGSGFCPIVCGRPRAMLALALDASVGKVKILFIYTEPKRWYHPAISFQANGDFW